LKLPPGGSFSYASASSGISTIADLVQMCTADLIISFVIPSRQPDLTLTADAGMPSLEIRIGAYIYGDGTRKWRKYFEGWEDSGHAVGG
jgi:hypothetical protein